MNVLFLIQNFVTKSLADSAGFNEIAAPLIQSGLVSHYDIKDWSISRELVDQYIEGQINAIADQVSGAPVIVYGAGDHTQSYWRFFSRLNVVAVADKQVELQGAMFHGVPVVAPEEIGSLPVVISSRAWEKSIFESLTKLGHKTYTLYDAIDGLVQSVNAGVVQSAIQQSLSTQYDLIIYTPADPAESLSLEALDHLKHSTQAQLAVVWWDYDDTSYDNPYTQLEKCSLHVADKIIDPGNFSKTRKMREKAFPYQDHPNVERICLLATPVNSVHFYPREKKIDVAIFGSKVGLRGRWIEFLLSNFPEQAKHFGGVSGGATPLAMEEYARLVGETKIVVNTQTYSFRTQCKGKVREALASGALLLEQENPDTREFIGEQNFVKFFSTEAELEHLIEYYLSHEVERAALAQQGYEWYQKNWSSIAWSKKVLSEFSALA